MWINATPGHGGPWGPAVGEEVANRGGLRARQGHFLGGHGPCLRSCMSPPLSVISRGFRIRVFGCDCRVSVEIETMDNERS